MKKKINKNIPKYKFGAAEVGGTLQGLGAGLSAIPTPFTQIAGMAFSTVGDLWGEDSYVNQKTGDINYGKGLAKVFGRGKTSLHNESNRIKNSLADAELIEKLNYDYYNDPYNSTNMNVFAAAEGAVVRKPVLAKVSPGELRIDPDTLKYEEIPGDGGKPNDDDNVTKILGEGEIIASNAEHMKMPNGKTPADNAKIILDSNMSEQQKKKMIKKLTNWQEANKTESQEYAKFGDGTGKRGVPDLSDMFLYRQKDGKFVMQDINGNRYDVPEMMLPYIQGDERGYYFGSQTGVAPSAGKWNGSMNFAKQMVNSKNIAKLKNSATKVFGRNTKPASISGPTKPVKGTSPDVLGKPKTAQEAAQMARNERTANMWQQLTSKGGAPQKTLEGPQTWSTARGSSNLWENPMALQSGDDIAQAINKAYYLNKGLPTAAVVATMLGGAGTFLTHEALKDKPTVSPAKTNSSTVAPVETPQTTESVSTSTPVDKKVVKPSNKKVTNTTTTSTPAVNVSSAIKNPILPKYDRLSFAEPFQFNNQHLRYAPGNYVPIKPLDIEVADEPVDEIGLPSDKTRLNINWGDLAYKAASIFTPLFDKEKSESVQYQVPIAKYRPTYVDIDPQRRAIDESYAIARYNQSNISPSTGAGMAYGLQAASNRAKQLADVYSWQTNTQNNLIGQNVDTYNKWSADYANIMNNVYDKTAANRATARNINRQNTAAALKNWGQIRRDNKAYEMDRMKLQMLDPMLQYGYENYDNYLKWKKENGYG